MLQRLTRWINQRWPLDRLLQGLLDEEVAGGASFAYSFGSIVLFLFALQALTGVFQLFYYVPTTDHAYDSINYLRTQVPFGWLIHDLHYWGANAMVVMVCAHICRVYIWGAYQPPRELTWWFGVGLFFLVLGMTFTGAPLPWDELGYWALEVGTSIAGTLPVIGLPVKELLRGGGTMNQLTLSRMFVAHVVLLPGVMAALVGAHLVAFRTSGNVGPWDPARRRRSGRFWPDQAYRDTLVITLVLVVLVGLCSFAAPPVTGPADPFDTSYQPKPEWNFLFLYQMLKLFPGNFEVLGTVGIPLLGVVAMLVIPFLDRGPERSPARRPWMMLFAAAVAATVLAFTVLGALSHPGAAAGGRNQEGGQQTGAGPPTAAPSDQVTAGRKLFSDQGCSGCHKIRGEGGTTGPQLSGDTLAGRSDDWLATQIRSPKSHFPSTVMPAYQQLDKAQIEQLVAFLKSVRGSGENTTAPAGGGAGTAPATEPSSAPRKEGEKRLPGEAATLIGHAPHGAEIFRRQCRTCHGSKGAAPVPNPGAKGGKVPSLNPISKELYSNDAATFARQIDVYLQHGAVPEGQPALKMPAFGDSHTLSQQEIAEVEAYLLSLNGVDRAQLVHPGMQPVHFFLLVVALFILGGVGAVVFRREAD
jgi:quinol-cytochrome oxidoreductase complex cytochrome b subunit